MKPENSNKALKKNLVLGFFSVLVILLLVAIISSPLFKNIRDTLTGGVVDANSNTEAENKVPTKINTVSIHSEMYLEDFQVPIDNLDLTIEAEEVDILMPSADITLTLEEPMVFEAFTGTLNWRDSMFTLEGQLTKYLNKLIKINWKTAEDVRIRVNHGVVSISQINIGTFSGVVSGEVKLGDKVTINPEKDLVTLKGFRGSFRSVIEDIQTQIILDGNIDNIFVNSKEFELNIN